MTKPVEPVVIATLDGKTSAVPALFDSGAMDTIVRADCFPPGGFLMFHYPKPQSRGTAAKGGTLTLTGETILTVTIGKKRIRTEAFVSPDLARELIIGARTMQGWDITIRNINGKTEVVVGVDMDNPLQMAVE